MYMADTGRVLCDIQQKHPNFITLTADFGIAARISETMTKRKSFIGTPYW